MSAATASSHGKRRLPARADDEAQPVRLTLRRVKFASSLFVGALMLGVVSNAVLMQPDHPQLRIASNAAPPRADAEAPVPPSQASAPASHDKAPGPTATPVTRAVDPMPVGSIVPAPGPALRDKPRIVRAAAKPHPHKADGIAAFLKDGKVQ